MDINFYQEFDRIQNETNPIVIILFILCLFTNNLFNYIQPPQLRGVRGIPAHIINRWVNPPPPPIFYRIHYLLITPTTRV